jgi:hypothetical protein
MGDRLSHIVREAGGKSQGGKDPGSAKGTFY